VVNDYIRIVSVALQMDGKKTMVKNIDVEINHLMKRIGTLKSTNLGGKVEDISHAAWQLKISTGSPTEDDEFDDVFEDAFRKNLNNIKDFASAMVMIFSTANDSINNRTIHWDNDKKKRFVVWMFYVLRNKTPWQLLRSSGVSIPDEFWVKADRLIGQINQNELNTAYMNEFKNFFGKEPENLTELSAAMIWLIDEGNKTLREKKHFTVWIANIIMEKLKQEVPVTDPNNLQL
jgi:hypothetical protein